MKLLKEIPDQPPLALPTKTITDLVYVILEQSQETKPARLDPS